MWFVVMFILCLIAGYFMYKYTNTQKDSKFIPNDEYRTTTQKPEGDLILFYVTWCPYSQTALTEWNTIKNSYTSSEYIISFSETDCDKYSQLATQYKITEYPTIILVKGGKNYEYDAQLSEASLNLFINTVMKQ